MDESRLAGIRYALPWDPAQKRRELTTIAYSQAEGVGTIIKSLELLPYMFVVFYYPCPTLCRVKHISVAEASDKYNSPEAFKRNPGLKQISHGNIPWLKPCLKKGRGHLPVSVAALFAYDRDLRLISSERESPERSVQGSKERLKDCPFLS